MTPRLARVDGDGADLGVARQAAAEALPAVVADRPADDPAGLPGVCCGGPVGGPA